MREYIKIVFLLAKFLLACFSYLATIAGIMLLITEIEKALR